MSLYRTNPGLARAYRGRWNELWSKRLAAGAVSRDEEEHERRALLEEVAGVSSSSQLTEAGARTVMVAMAAELACLSGGEMGETALRDPWRERRIRKIWAIAHEFRPADPESYIRGVLGHTQSCANPAQWRTALTNHDLQALMLSLVSQQRRNRKAAQAQCQKNTTS